jgi:pyruvate formate lyase activating enzyme
VNTPTRFWSALPDGRVRCDVCPRACRIGEGKRGFCHVRLCEDGEVKLATGGRSSGFCVDPIEKKPLYHFLPGSAVLSFGTAGCNLACRFCQNWELSRSREIDRRAEVAPPEVVAEAAVRLDCPSVALTYNDPVIFLEYAVEIAAACRARDVRTVAVTAGYISPPARAEFFRLVDAANIDLKAFTRRFYQQMTGGELEPVLDTLRYLVKDTDVWVEITNLIIPGENDSEEELDAMTRWVVKELGPQVPMHFTAFHPAGKLLDRAPTPPETLLRAIEIAEANGVRHAYPGNLRTPDGGRTRCHACGASLLLRRGARILEWGLDAEGCCRSCGVRCEGVFDARPGEWGGACLPVQISDFR